MSLENARKFFHLCRDNTHLQNLIDKVDEKGLQPITLLGKQYDLDFTAEELKAVLVENLVENTDNGITIFNRGGSKPPFYQL